LHSFIYGGAKCAGMGVLEKMHIIGLVELPRRIFLKSDADVRSNILFAECKKSDERSDYPIHAELVRKVGYKMGEGFTALPIRDEQTGLELRNPDTNEMIIDTDFNLVKDNFLALISMQKENKTISWEGAHLSDITDHPQLDMKPRRLTRNALVNLRTIISKPCKRLYEIADIVENVTVFSEEFESFDPLFLVEGQDIRAAEGSVVLKTSEKRWQAEVRKTSKGYHMHNKDIVVGLVRPERRNIGLYIGNKDNVFGCPDAVAIIRQKYEEYPVEWIFQVLRTEQVRIQLWTESGGTSYDKLTLNQLKNILIPIPPENEIKAMVRKVRVWADAQKQVQQSFDDIWEDEDRRVILNSPNIGLEGRSILAGQETTL
ncbi:MAG: hypothetical protein LUC90_05925, partial [Lachnospiraceae bacterium]|nr:hypothetical protein [Lachnospiraceae bacterium]